MDLLLIILCVIAWLGIYFMDLYRCEMKKQREAKTQHEKELRAQRRAKAEWYRKEFDNGLSLS
jgi:hypothetical protein